MKPILLLRENTVMKMVGMTLRVLGYTCRFAEALVEGDSGRAILDLESFEVFGESRTLALARRMLHQFPEYELLFLTTNPKVATALSQGGHCVLLKPFHQRDLAAMVQTREQKHPAPSKMVSASQGESS